MADEEVAFDPGFKVVGTLVKLSGKASMGFAGAARDLASRGEVLLEVEGDAAGLGMTRTGATWVRFDEQDSPWERIHSLARAGGMGFGANGIVAAEPDWQWQVAQPPLASEAATIDAWHLGPQFTRLGDARGQVDADAQKAILIAHLDTGFDPHHAQKPRIIHAGHKSFVKGDPPGNGAQDLTPASPVTQRGHGTATLAILAGPDYGAAPDATLLPLRVGNDVVIVTTGTIVAGISEAVVRRADILSMSMGGRASAALAEAVNAAYDQGMLLVTAAGNTVGGLPFPTIVWPARFRRVVAACGIMRDGRAYEWPLAKPMAGCSGPAAKMRFAMASYTPDIPWARIGSKTDVGAAGGTSAATPQIAGAAALWLARHSEALKPYTGWERGEAVREALFRSASGGKDPYDPAIEPHAKFGWGVLDAVKLIETAPLPRQLLRKAPRADASWNLLKLVTGTGIGVADAGRDELFELELVQLLDERQDLLGDSASGTFKPDIEDPDMFGRDEAPTQAQEAAQKAAAKAVLERVLAVEGLGSKPLRETLAMRLSGAGARRRTPAAPPSLASAPAAAPPPPAPGSAAAAAVEAGQPPPVAGPARRRLRIFARDPSLGASLRTVRDLEATVDVAFEERLLPGPVGEYLAIVDVDPATDRIYSPVDLNALDLALSDGLKPSEGNPQFHQQMVYAVAMRTIEVFERALGRRALWASGRQPGDTHASAFCRQLRIYPHALRQLNAFYDPSRVALLFGYQPSAADARSSVPEGTMVFTCLSTDVIAHETTHALLDGMTPGYRDASNPDVLAFHEGFADIVALFEQFRLRDLVARQLDVRDRKLSMAGTLGALAGQFGRASHKGAGPLRDYATRAGKPPEERTQQYDIDLPVHELGAVLVSAVYDAFLAMVDKRTEKPMRLASGGSGMLPEGELHPVIAEALTDEICQAAADIQRIAIRALDYLPPNDLTFGDYLRAMITADEDAWPEDRSGYRVAITEAFRRLNIYPRGLRALSDETLAWRRPPAHLARAAWLKPMVHDFGLQPGPDFTREWMHAKSCERADVAQRAIEAALDADLAEKDMPLHTLLGLEPELPRYAENMTIHPESRQGRTNIHVEGVRPKIREQSATEVRERSLAFDVVLRVRQRRPERVGAGGRRFWFRGGATLLIDPYARVVAPKDEERAGQFTVHPEIRHAIRKNMLSKRRLEEELKWRDSRSGGGVQATYFGEPDAPGNPMAAGGPFAMLHRELLDGEG
jgi:hypothetical protein